jgi:hypothetical protein
LVLDDRLSLLRREVALELLTWLLLLEMLLMRCLAVVSLLVEVVLVVTLRAGLGSGSLLRVLSLVRIVTTVSWSLAASVLIALVIEFSWVIIHEDMLKHSENLRIVQHLSRVGWALLFSIVLEISLISDSFLLCLSYFLDFVVINVQLFTVKGVVVKFLLCLHSLVRVLVANESIALLSIISVYLDVLNFSKFAEKFF